MLRFRIAFTIAAGMAFAAPAAAQFNQEVLRYQASQVECREAAARRAVRCRNDACRAAAETWRQRCVAQAERRYQEVLRRAMEQRR